MNSEQIKNLYIQKGPIEIELFGIKNKVVGFGWVKTIMVYEKHISYGVSVKPYIEIPQDEQWFITFVDGKKQIMVSCKIIDNLNPETFQKTYLFS